jgi:tubulin-folding cofactor B
MCRYVGKCSRLPKGYWIGVQFDEPVGKNDGSVKGQRYFTCPDGYGSLLRPDKVKAGDYPEVDEFRFADEDEI